MNLNSNIVYYILFLGNKWKLPKSGVCLVFIAGRENLENYNDHDMQLILQYCVVCIKVIKDWISVLQGCTQAILFRVCLHRFLIYTYINFVWERGVNIPILSSVCPGYFINIF